MQQLKPQFGRYLPQEGLSHRRARFLFLHLFANIPKLALAILLMVYGGAYILAAPDNSQIIINTVAIVFVLCTARAHLLLVRACP